MFRKARKAVHIGISTALRYAEDQDKRQASYDIFLRLLGFTQK